MFFLCLFVCFVILLFGDEHLHISWTFNNLLEGTSYVGCERPQKFSSLGLLRQSEINLQFKGMTNTISILVLYLHHMWPYCLMIWHNATA